MDLTFTGRGLPVSDEVREQAQHKLSRLERLAPRALALELELVAEHHPSPISRLTMIKGTLRVPRKTFHAHAEADDVRSALDDLAEKLKRQLRDHHGKRLRRWHRGVRFPRGSVPPPADTTG
jgi:ribosomal subunit interface protein